MHIHTFALSYPLNHPANADGAKNKYLYSIESSMRLDRIRQDEKIKINIQHGPTPTAPTIMTHSDGFAIGLEKKIKIESNALKLTFDREEFKENPMPWEPTFEGEKCHAPIYYEECNE